MKLAQWVMHKLMYQPETLMSLLIAARNEERAQINASALFRAGVRFARSHPEQADELLKESTSVSQEEEG